MQTPQLSSPLANLVADLEEDAVLELVRRRVENGDDPLKIIDECNEGMRAVGQRYENGDYFIAGLIMAGEIFSEVVEMVQPILQQQAQGKTSGRVLVGTVSGDIHDIGKNMVGMLLACHGFEVIDLGVDVPPEDFAAQAVQVQPDIVGLSGLISASIETMKATVTRLRAAAQQHNLGYTIVIGGSMIDDQICQYIGADYWMPDAMAGVRLCEQLLREG